ncbi:hypothetical protein ACEQPO_03125 [Bacillus sp. SL00103]
MREGSPLNVRFLISLRKKDERSRQESVQESVNMMVVAEQVTNYMSVIRSILSPFTIENKRQCHDMRQQSATASSA